MKEDFFKKPGFQNRLDHANKKLKDYLEEKEFELDDIKVEELIQWHDETPSGAKQIYPHNNCPEKIKNIVADIIKTSFETDK